MDDAQALALCAFMEANLEPDEGLAAIARVILNRMRLRYQSDGTVQGTIFHGDGVAFSWAAFAMKGGRYVRVAEGPQAIAARAETLLRQAQAWPKAWARACDITERVGAGTYAGPLYDRLTDDAVLYLNPAISHADWALPEMFIERIGHHAFYRA